MYIIHSVFWILKIHISVFQELLKLENSNQHGMFHFSTFQRVIYLKNLMKLLCIAWLAILYKIYLVMSTLYNNGLSISEKNI